MSTTSYLITDSSAKSSSENIQNSLQTAISSNNITNYIKFEYFEGSTKSNSKNFNKHEYSAKSNRSKKQHLRFRQKLNPVCEYIDELSNELSDKAFKVCKICNNKWAEGTSISTIKSHFKSKYSLIFEDLQQNSSSTQSSFYSTSVFGTDSTSGIF
ncbi:16785_t:CDS:2 [Dentiscutata erythropus]|uniref:16785_t:CDS:1 n=1 Tax=Dentiscutata erythropus TaxID=1348616 RepID=A0A9N9BUY2_9GLOM|nr:16785_t:CDS:2 [Dentiscutata erythropus]